MFQIQSLAVLGLLALCACGSKTEIAGMGDIEPTYRAAKKIEAALAAGVNYQAFGDLVRDASYEGLLLADKVKFGGADEKSKRLLPGFLKLIDTYKDSGTVWGAQIRSENYSGSVVALADKYGAALLVDRRLGRVEDLDGLRAEIWRKATPTHEDMNRQAFGGSITAIPFQPSLPPAK